MLSFDLEKLERKFHDCPACNTKMQFTMSSLVVTDGIGRSSVSRYVHLNPCSGGKPLAEAH